MADQKKESRFASLRVLRQQRQEEEADVVEETVLEENPTTKSATVVEDVLTNKMQSKPLISAVSSSRKKVPKDSVSPKRGPGRPKGRRSNPDYTQISAYIPLDLLLEVQDELADERRENRQRTARPVSDLVEELLYAWLKKRKSKKSAK